MKNIKTAMNSLNKKIGGPFLNPPIPFDEFIQILSKEPLVVIRNIFQIFHDMVKNYVDEEIDEHAEDPETINYTYYDCTRLFVQGSDNPFMADRLFANRLVKQVEDIKRGTQQNKIYIFEGPHGCGKSTFLNNFLNKFEEYANTKEGRRFETVWRLDKKLFTDPPRHEAVQFYKKLCHLLEIPQDSQVLFNQKEESFRSTEDYIEVPCPSHDNPLLMIPKKYRRDFFDTLFKNDEFKWKLFTDKEFEWIFNDRPCTICSSISHALLNTLKKPSEVFKMIYARPYRFNRRLGQGIGVFNPGDKPIKQHILKNEPLQQKINLIFKNTEEIEYIYSRYAKTNNGIYALMDVKGHNSERLIELHNIISEGIHKVEDIEETVNSLLIAIMNPEDKKNIEDLQSFSDRIESIPIPYILDINTEVEIYRNIFGKYIDESFLPRVLHNFARIIISTRLNTESKAMHDWIDDAKRYKRYCDKNLQLLKMEIYTGHIPNWLSEDDRNRFTATRRKRIIKEGAEEGRKGFSGRDSIKIFNDFFSSFSRDDGLINMSNLCDFFTKIHKVLGESIPKGFLDSLLHMYNYTILQEVKESLFYFNEEQIAKDLQNYMFAINFEMGASATCNYTGDKLQISEDLFKSIEIRLLGPDTDKEKREKFRKTTQKEYASKTLTKEIMIEKKSLTETDLYLNLHQQYEHHIKETVLEPFLDNDNFRRAIKDFGTEDFKSYDEKIKNDVTFLIDNLCTKYRYKKKGAKEVCIYTVDNKLAEKFKNP